MPFYRSQDWAIRMSSSQQELAWTLFKHLLPSLDSCIFVFGKRKEVERGVSAGNQIMECFISFFILHHGPYF